jgi:hypothetical protein
MKITTDEGQKMELVATDYRVGEDDSFQPLYALKPVVPMEPVKKTEKGKKFHALEFFEVGVDDGDELFRETLDLNPTTALKLSEAIFALVEYVTNRPAGGTSNLIEAAVEARESFQESQQ